MNFLLSFMNKCIENFNSLEMIQEIESRHFKDLFVLPECIGADMKLIKCLNLFTEQLFDEACQ